MKDDSGKLIGELRKALGSITLEDIAELEKPQLSDAEQMTRSHDAELFYIHWAERVLRAMNYAQLQKIGEEATNDVQVQFGRGTLNGLYLVEQWFKDQLSLSQSRFEKQETVPPGEITS